MRRTACKDSTRGEKWCNMRTPRVAVHMPASNLRSLQGRRIATVGSVASQTRPLGWLLVWACTASVKRAGVSCVVWGYLPKQHAHLLLDFALVNGCLEHSRELGALVPTTRHRPDVMEDPTQQRQRNATYITRCKYSSALVGGPASIACTRSSSASGGVNGSAVHPGPSSSLSFSVGYANIVAFWLWLLAHGVVARGRKICQGCEACQCGSSSWLLQHASWGQCSQERRGERLCRSKIRSARPHNLAQPEAHKTTPRYIVDPEYCSGDAFTPMRPPLRRTVLGRTSLQLCGTTSTTPALPA